MAEWLRETSGAVSLTVYVQPGAKRSGIAGVHGDALRIRVAAPAVEGRANEALVALLAGRLGLPRSAIELKAGLASRRKQILVHGAAADAVRRVLAHPAVG